VDRSRKARLRRVRGLSPRGDTLIRRFAPPSPTRGEDASFGTADDLEPANEQAKVFNYDQALKQARKLHARLRKIRRASARSVRTGASASRTPDIEGDCSRAVAEIARSKKRLHNLRAYA
jgi:hypothetical protein